MCGASAFGVVSRVRGRGTMCGPPAHTDILGGSLRRGHTRSPDHDFVPRICSHHQRDSARQWQRTAIPDKYEYCASKLRSTDSTDPTDSTEQVISESVS